MKIIKTLLACTLVACTAFAFLSINAKAEESFDIVYEARITGINNEQYVSTDYSFVIQLSETDYMTADDWSAERNDYKWFNADEGRVEYDTVDLLENNLCNFPLDKHLDEYNYEQMILIDGVTLAQYKVDHPYYLIGNMRTRVNTLSISFVEPVLKDVTIIEVLAGCQLPTLGRSCKGESLTSCIEIQEAVKYERKNGTWVTYFEGYSEGVDYVGNENAFFLYNMPTYKNHPVTPLTEYTLFFDGRNVNGKFHYGKALASTSDTQKGYLTVLQFVNPISVEDFNQLNLKLYSNHKRTIFSYNANNITTSTLGSALESFTLDGGSYTSVSMDASLYADNDGMLRTIVFKFNEDGEPFINGAGEEEYDDNGNLIRDQLFFMSYNVANRDASELLTKDSLIIIENDGVYEITFRFNRSGEDAGVALDKSKVTLNGQTLKKLLDDCKGATATWTKAGSVYQISVTLPKAYVGAAQIKNADNGFACNSMGVLKGLKFPDGSELERSYTCHIYGAEKILDSEIATDYEKTTVLGISHRYDAGSNNLRFSIHFDKRITSANYYHACEIERWRETDLYASSSLYYDKGISNVFVKGGFKSSLLDCVVINGKTIGEWHAHEVGAMTNVQTHYGASGLEYVDVVFESHSKLTYAPLAELVETGNGITIEIKEGWKFLTNCQVKKTQTFVLKNGAFSEVIASKAIHVYYDGSEVQNGENVTVKTAVCPTSVLVTGIEDYQITHQTNGKTTVFTINYGEDKVFTFTVLEDSIEPVVTKPQTTAPEKKKGCKSSVELPIVASSLLLLAMAVVLKRRGIHE